MLHAHHRPLWTLARSAFHPDDCRRVADMAEARGWRDGGWSDGSHRDNVQVCFLERDGEMEGFTRELDRLAQGSADLMGIEIQTGLNPEYQVSKWEPGTDHIEWHQDHRHAHAPHMPVHRKICVYVALSEGMQGLELDGDGMIHCSQGDALVFSALQMHQRPPMEHRGISLIAWILGPNWR